LNFKKKYKSLLKQGKKVATLRIGSKNYKKDEVVKIVAGGEYLGKARIIEVRQIPWKEINRRDVMMEGMKRKKDLEKELKAIYGKFGKNKVFTQIVFEMIGDKNGGGEV